MTVIVRNENSITWRLIRSRIESTGAIEIQASGISMYPFIRGGDRCRFEKRTFDAVRTGDVLLMQSGKRLLGHRLIRIEQHHRDVVLICKGDTNLYPDPPIHWSDVIGVLTMVQSTKRSFRLHSFWARAWTLVILLFPAYSQIFRRIALRRFRRLMVVEPWAGQ